MESGKAADSLMLAHDIVLARLKDMDSNAIVSYLSSEKLEQLKDSYPIGNSTVVVYNDFGYALEQAGEYERAYQLLVEVEREFPGRIVLKLNIADALWGIDQGKAASYYNSYIASMREVGKSKLIPVRALKRSVGGD